MPGQPAWTLTEMLECNLPLCWAGGGDCNVGPTQLGLQPIDFIIKSNLRCRAAGVVLFGAVFSRAVFFSEQFFFSKEKRCEAAVVTGGSWCYGRFFWSRKICSGNFFFL